MRINQISPKFNTKTKHGISGQDNLTDTYANAKFVRQTLEFVKGIFTDSGSNRISAWQKIVSVKSEMEARDLWRHSSPDDFLGQVN